VHFKSDELSQAEVNGSLICKAAVVGVRADGFVAWQSQTTLIALHDIMFPLFFPAGCWCRRPARASAQTHNNGGEWVFAVVVGVRAKGFVTWQSPTTLIEVFFPAGCAVNILSGHPHKYTTTTSVGFQTNAQQCLPDALCDNPAAGNILNCATFNRKAFIKKAPRLAEVL